MIIVTLYFYDSLTRTRKMYLGGNQHAEDKKTNQSRRTTYKG